ncbi:MAG: hypothetical protein WC648_01800 [Candidatus Paceibacterota bacterium]|jgi:hypothetical protein
MTYRKSYKDNGFILLDIILALVLSTIFVSLQTGAIIDSHRLYLDAKNRNQYIDAYEAGSFEEDIRPFGNDLFEKIFSVNIDAANVGSTSEYLPFVSVNRDLDISLGDFVGTPMCSNDFSSKGPIGSYIALMRDNDPSFPNNPILSTTAYLLPIDPLLPLTDFEVRGGVAYVSADSAIASDPDILIFRLGGTDGPELLSSINTGPGIVSLSLVQDRIFAAAGSTAFGLHVVKMGHSDSMNMELENRYKLPLPFATATPAMASSIFYNDGIIFLGTEKREGPEFVIIDVSDPLNLNMMGGVEINSKINDIFVRNDKAYIATAAPDQLQVMDVSDPVLPEIVNVFSPSGWSRQEGKVISYFEDSLDFGRTSGGFNIRADHEIFSWGSTTLDSLTDPVSMDIGGGVYGIVRDRSHLFLASRENDREFQIYKNDASGSESESESESNNISLPVAPQTITCDNDSIYILARTAPVIYSISYGDQ